MTTPEEYDAQLTRARAAALPADHSGPLPLRVMDPSSLRPGAIDFYARAEGSTDLILKGIPVGDTVSRLAYLRQVAAGEITVFDEGQSLQTVEDAARVDGEMKAVFEAEFARIEKAQSDEHIAGVQRHADRFAARAAAQIEQHRRPA